MYRSTTNDSGDAVKINGSDVTGTSYNDTTAVAGTTYYYWVKARNLAGTSGWSLSNAGTRLNATLEVEPNAPDLLNNLAMAYTAQGRAEEAEALLRAVHEGHPEYLFGCTGLARLEVARGQLDVAKALLEPLLARQRLHVGELGALCAAQIEVLLAERNRDSARSWLELWTQVDPDNPALEVYRQRLAGGWQQRLFGWDP